MLTKMWPSKGLLLNMGAYGDALLLELSYRASRAILKLGYQLRKVFSQKDGEKSGSLLRLPNSMEMNLPSDKALSVNSAGDNAMNMDIPI